MNGAARELSARVALVTGAGRGLGRAIAVGLAEQGARVVLAARTRAELERVARQVEAAGGEALVVPTDLSVPEETEALARRALDWSGTVDVLVLNAGRADVAPFTEADDDLWRRILEVNLLSTVRLARAVGRSMCERGRGSVILVGSVLGRTAVPGGLVPYATTKGAIEQLGRSLAVEWARAGVRVNVVAPGYFETEMNEAALSDDRTRSFLLRRTPMRRFGKPEEVLSAVRYLASDGAAYVTGSVVHVDGGWTAG